MMILLRYLLFVLIDTVAVLGFQQNYSSYMGMAPPIISMPTDMSPPCCADMIGQTACKRLKRKNEFKFEEKCQNEVDFSLVQCCRTCGSSTVSQRHTQLFKEGMLSKNCFDRRSPKFCEKFKVKKENWASTPWSCSGQFAHLSFRICRKSCLLCRKDLYEGLDKTPYKATRCGATIMHNPVEYPELDALEREFNDFY